MILLVFEVLFVHLICFGLFVALAATAPEGDEDESTMEGVGEENAVRFFGSWTSKWALSLKFDRFGRASTRQG